jgi:membrane protein implicated in regulation of membrane protease activity
MLWWLSPEADSGQSQHIWLLIALAVLLIAIASLGKIRRAIQRPAVGPREKLLGQVGRVVVAVRSEQRGKVLVLGEIWDALSDTLAEAGTEVRVTGFDAVEPWLLVVMPLKR